MTTFKTCYNTIEKRKYQAVVHRSWAERLGDLEALFEEISADPELVENGRKGQGCTMQREIGGTNMYVKLYLPGRKSRRLRDLLGSHRAIREWEAHCRAEDNGIPTALMVVAFTSKKFWNCRHLVLTLPAAGQSVRKMLPALREHQKQREELLRFLGREIAVWHRKGFCHGHLNRSHLFIDEAWNLRTIDLEGSFIRKPLPDGERENNLRQLRKSLVKNLPDAGEFKILEDAYEREFVRSGSQVLATST